MGNSAKLTGKCSQAELLAVTAILVFSCVLVWPILLNGFWPFSGNARLHISWYSNFSKQFWNGDRYPRWLMGLNQGLGSPVFFYYPPIPYFITCLFQPLFQNDPQCWNQLALSVYCALAGSGISCYAWLRNGQCSKLSSAVAAMLFMLMPYHLRTDLYVRGAFAEFWAFVWLPLVLTAVRALARNARCGVIGLSSSYALLIMTHLPTTLVFSAIPVCYAVVSAENHRIFRVLAKTTAAMTLGVGLSSIYLVPAMTMQEHVSMAELTRFNKYDNSFFLSDSQLPSLSQDFNSAIFVSVLTIVVSGLCGLMLVFTSEKRKERAEVWFWGAVATVCLFMMLSISKPVWELVPVLQIIQFPWRFGTVLCIAVATTIGYGLSSVSSPVSIGRLAWIQLLCGIVLIWFYATWLAVWPAHFPDNLDSSYFAQNGEDAIEYSPRWVGTQRDQVISKYGRGHGDSPVEILGSSDTEVSIEHWNPREILLNIQSPVAVDLLVHRFYFPGWAALLDGQAVPALPSNPDGLICVNVPSGQHRLQLRLLATMPERAGQIISAISLLVIVACGMREAQNKAYESA